MSTKVFIIKRKKIQNEFNLHKNKMYIFRLNRTKKNDGKLNLKNIKSINVFTDISKIKKKMYVY